MKTHDFEFDLMHAAPKESVIDTIFTDRVMATLPSLQTLSAHIIHNKSKRTVWHKLRHLPKFALIILAIATLCIASTVTYAVVETIKQNVKTNGSDVRIDESGVNEFGREQLRVTFDNCAEQEKNSRTYELKKDSGLSAEEGAKVLRAQCERDAIIQWMQKDPLLNENAPSLNSFYGRLRNEGFVGTFKGRDETGISLHSATAFAAHERVQTMPFPETTRVVESGKVVDPTTLTPEDTVLYFSPLSSRMDPTSSPSNNVTIFKLTLEAKYYSLDMLSYIRARQPCENNKAHTCVVSNHINMVYLEVSRGGMPIDPTNELTYKHIQGKVVSWNDQEIKLDVGKGMVYTFRTQSNVIDTYNQFTVYGLKSYDAIYSKTDPNDLKIGLGDSLEVSYGESLDQSAQTLEWSQVTGINLLVERRVDTLDVLRKY